MVTPLGRTVSGLGAIVLVEAKVLASAAKPLVSTEGPMGVCVAGTRGLALAVVQASGSVAPAVAYVATSKAIALVNHPVRRWRSGRSAIAIRSWSVVPIKAEATRLC